MKLYIRSVENHVDKMVECGLVMDRELSIS